MGTIYCLFLTQFLAVFQRLPWKILMVQYLQYRNPLIAISACQVTRKTENTRKHEKWKIYPIQNCLFDKQLTFCVRNYLSHIQYKLDTTWACFNITILTLKKHGKQPMDKMSNCSTIKFCFLYYWTIGDDIRMKKLDKNLVTFIFLCPFFSKYGICCVYPKAYKWINKK